jgi:hypothetical protein
MVDRAQKNLLIFLCSLVFLTVLAVLAANVGLLPTSKTTGDFAKWGMAAVLAEIVGLFVIVARGVFAKRSGSYSITIGPPEDVEVDFTRIAWDPAACFIKISGESSPIRPVRSTSGPSFEIRLPYSLVDKVDEQTAVEIYLTDKFGNAWEVEALYLNTKTGRLRALGSVQKILADYGSQDE